jgi:hypothetical protein
LGLVGSAVLVIDETGRSLRVEPMPETDFEIRWTILFHCPFYHSAVAFRRSCFEAAGQYRPGERISCDHYLWFDMLPFCRARNLRAPLVRYRLRPDSLSASYAGGNPRERTRPIREALWREIGLTYGLQEGQVALDVSALLRGQAPKGAEQQAAAAEVIQFTLSRVLALRADFMREAEQAAVDRFAKALMVGVAKRQARLPEMLRRAWRLVRTIGWRATILRALRG